MTDQSDGPSESGPWLTGDDPRDWRQGPWETYEEFVRENGPWPCD